MDSLTHIVIGAAIGDVMLGKKIGRWGMLVGAIAKSIPDFDLFYTGLASPRAYMCYHRGHTHSLFWEMLYGIPIAYLLSFLFRKKVSFLQFLSLILVCLWGHSLLDLCTNYGTRLLLPFTNTAYALNNIAIADLVFTIPILLLVLIALCIKNNNLLRQKFSKAAILYSLFYLSITFINKAQANHIANASLQQNNIIANAKITNPTILNNVLWYAVASNDSSVYIAEFSLLHKNKKLVWHQYPRNLFLLNNNKDSADIALLKWFDGNFFMAKQSQDTLNIYPGKYGRNNMMEDSLDKSILFHYKLYKQNNTWQMGMQEPATNNFKAGFVDLWNRINGRN